MDRPIIFSGQMVRALLDGRKTQTRRLVSSPLVKTQPGDRLWVREAWAVPENWGQRSAADLEKSCLSAGYDQPWAPIHYLADGARINWGGWREHQQGKGRPSIHMPRWASRLTLVVTEVRRQRLQEISDHDALAEGIAATEFWRDEHPPSICFSVLWNSLHGSEAWNDNPEIVALTFTVHRCNIDSMAQVETA